MNVDVAGKHSPWFAQLWKGSAGSLVLRLAYVGLGSLVAIVLARTLGPKNYGIYVYAYALITLLATPVRFGLPALVVREIARMDATQQWSRMKGLWRWANSAVAVGTIIVICGAGVVVWLLGEHARGQTSATFAWGLALIPLIAFGSLRGAALRGLRKVVQGQLPEEIIRPLLLVLFVVLAAQLTKKAVEPSEVMVLHIIAAAIAFVVGAWMLRHASPQALRACKKPEYEARSWLVALIPFATMEGMFLVNTQIDIVLLGVFSSAKDVGTYRVASQGATFVGLGFQALGMALMPHYTRLHAIGDLKRFKLLSSAGTFGGFVLGVPVFIIFLVLGKPILGYVFGPGYVAGYVALVVLSASQLLNVAFGMSGRLLNAAGLERETAGGIFVGAICNVVLNLALIPLLGMDGAAIATGASLVVWNVVLWKMTKAKISVDSSLLSALDVGTISSLRRAFIRKA